MEPPSDAQRKAIDQVGLPLPSLRHAWPSLLKAGLSAWKCGSPSIFHCVAPGLAAIAMTVQQHQPKEALAGLLHLIWPHPFAFQSLQSTTPVVALDIQDSMSSTLDSRMYDIILNFSASCYRLEI